MLDETTTISFVPRTRQHPRSTLFPYTTLFRSRTRTASRALRPPGRPACPATTTATPPRPAPGRGRVRARPGAARSEEHTSELQSQFHLVCRLLLEKKKKKKSSESK